MRSCAICSISLEPIALLVFGQTTLERAEAGISVAELLRIAGIPGLSSFAPRQDRSIVHRAIQIEVIRPFCSASKPQFESSDSIGLSSLAEQLVQSAWPQASHRGCLSGWQLVRRGCQPGRCDAAHGKRGAVAWRSRRKKHHDLDAVQGRRPQSATRGDQRPADGFLSREDGHRLHYRSRFHA
jgi:hypothetical protein